MEDNVNLWKMEADLNFWIMEDDLNFWKMEDDLIFENGRQPNFLKMEENLKNCIEDDLKKLKHYSFAEKR